MQFLDWFKTSANFSTSSDSISKMSLKVEQFAEIDLITHRLGIIICIRILLFQSFSII